MQSNVHPPERQPNESQATYLMRRQRSRRIVKRAMEGTPVAMVAGNNRRHLIKAAGGIRQFKRSKYRVLHVGYGLDRTT